MKAAIIGDPKRSAKYAPDWPIVKETDKVFFDLDAPVEEIVEKAGDADVLLADAIAKVPGELIKRLPGLKLIHSEGVAYNGIDTETAKNCGVPVCNCKGMNAGAVAEQAILLMLGLLRDVVGGNEAEKAGRQLAVKQAMMVRGITDLADCKVGLVGFGDIAVATADRLHAFGSQVFYWNHRRRTPEVEGSHHVKFLPLDELLEECDIISLHVAVTPETTGMVNGDFLAKMKPGSYLINTARGDLVDNAALRAALESGQIAGAGLDTIAPEPTTADNLLVDLVPAAGVRVLYSPHVGGITTGSFKRGYRMIWENVQRVAEGKRPERVVNGCL